jgi:hypothetical protein
MYDPREEIVPAVLYLLHALWLLRHLLTKL